MLALFANWGIGAWIAFVAGLVVGVVAPVVFIVWQTLKVRSEQPHDEDREDSSRD